MPFDRRLAVVLILVMVTAACGPASANPDAQDSVSQVQAAVTDTPQAAEAKLWGRVPYCNCLADAATANVAGALERANLTVRLQEQSPRDGWLYFVASFDPNAAQQEQVEAAVIAGGGEILEGPP